MKGNFEQCLKWVLVHEGGWANHPKDPGGATMKGVTQRTYDGYRRRMGQPVQSVRDISDHELQRIYKTQYWDAVRGDDLPSGLDYAVFDFAVNSGPGRAVRFLQEILRVGQDGIFGNQTMAAVRDLGDATGAIESLCTNRWNWVKRLRTFKTFGRGWTRRIMGEKIGAQDRDTGVIDRGVQMSRTETVTGPTKAAPGKAEGSETLTATIQDTIKDPGALTAIGGTLGSMGSLLTGNGPIQWAIALALVIAVITGAFLLVRSRNA